MGALKNVKVIDASQIMAGPYCTMILGDLGAEIIKIEKPNGGDDSRQMGPYINDESTCFFQINRNKKSIALDLKKEKGKEVFYQLIKDADVFVENYRPGVVKSLGIDYETLKGINPNLIYCSISGYGQTGPYAHKGGFDLVAQGLTGIMSMTGEPGGRPLKSGIAVYDIGAGLTAIYSILAAYIHKQNTGEGQHVDVSLAECGLPWFTWEAAAYFTNGTIPQPTGWRHRVSAPYQAIKTSDGYVMLGCANQRTWERLCAGVIGRHDWIQDPRFIDNTKRNENVEILEREIEEIFIKEDSSFWVEKCELHGVPCGPINNFAQAMQDPHFIERGMVQEVNHSKIGKMNVISSPTKFSHTPSEIKYPSPLLGEHTLEILKALHLESEEIDSLINEDIVFTQESQNLKMR